MGIHPQQILVTGEVETTEDESREVKKILQSKGNRIGRYRKMHQGIDGNSVPCLEGICERVKLKQPLALVDVSVISCC